MEIDLEELKKEFGIKSEILGYRRDGKDLILKHKLSDTRIIGYFD